MMLVNPLIYPTDTSFVRLLRPELRERLACVGFVDAHALCFEVPFCPISGAGAGILRDYEHCCYYRFFCTTEGVIEGLPDPELRVVVEHESHEIRDAISEASEPQERSAFTTLAAEEARHVPEFEELSLKYGHLVVRRAVTETARLASLSPVIPRYVLLFWLTANVVDEHSRYSASAIPMPEPMLAKEQRRRHVEFLNKVSKDYGSRLPFSVYAKLLVAATKT